jgi:dihydropteroate synthase
MQSNRRRSNHHRAGVRPVLGRRPQVMGILNLTPDSFSDGGLLSSPEAAYRRAALLVEAGADLLDLGAESTRPGAAPVPAAEELRRLLPALRRIVRLPVPISIDTYKPEVAAAALDEGARLINDITGLAHPAMRALAARRRVPVVIMHMRGTPQTMQRAPRYRDVVADVRRELLAAARRAEAAGVDRRRIILDPGLGFGKTARHNLQLVRALPRLVATGYPILVGPSRKGFIAKVLGPGPLPERVWGTAAVSALAVAAGVRFVRVHDVAQLRQVVDMAAAVALGRIPSGRSGAR